MKPNLIIADAIKTSWKAVKSPIWVLVGLLIGYTILSFILSIFGTPGSGSIAGSIIVNFVSLIIGLIFSLGYYKNMFQALDGLEPQFSAYGQQSRKILTYFIASVIYFIIVAVGLAFLIVPGIWLGIRLMYYMAFIIEEDAGIIESLKKSWEITKGQGWKLFLLGLTTIAIALLGFIVLFVGIFIAIPVINMIYCYSFRVLNALQVEAVEEHDLMEAKLA